LRVAFESGQNYRGSGFFAPTGFMRGKLNSFQRTMLQWNDLHAYNAVHVVRIAGALDARRLTTVVHDFLEQSGLTHLNLDCQRHTFDYAGGREELVIRIVAAGSEPLANLAAEVERQLNTAFDVSEGFNPFRFFVVPEAGSFLLGLVYFHAVADAESIVWLLKDLVDAYAGASVGGRSAPMELYPSGLTIYCGIIRTCSPGVCWDCRHRSGICGVLAGRVIRTRGT